MSQLLDLQSLIQGTVLSDNNDFWQWALGASNGYTVASVRSLVDSNLLDSSPVATRWNRSIPILMFSYGDLWSLFANWWELDIPFCANFSEWFDALHTSNKARMIIEGVGDNANGTLRLCDGHEKWEDGWEDLFDGVTATKPATIRKRVSKLSFDKCLEDCEIIKRRWTGWDVSLAEKHCWTVSR
ncbi:hypothetical protein Tco_0455439 [Tanacetum coccineum]